MLFDSTQANYIAASSQFFRLEAPEVSRLTGKKWPAWKKNAILAICSLYSFLGNSALLGPSTYIVSSSWMEDPSRILLLAALTNVK